LKIRLIFASCFKPFRNGAKTTTVKPGFNKPEGTLDFVLYNKIFVKAWLSTMKLTTEGLQRKDFIAGISLLKGLLFRDFSVN